MEQWVKDLVLKLLWLGLAPGPRTASGMAKNKQTNKKGVKCLEQYLAHTACTHVISDMSISICVLVYIFTLSTWQMLKKTHQKTQNKSQTNKHKKPGGIREKAAYPFSGLQRLLARHRVSVPYWRQVLPGLFELFVCCCCCFGF